MIPLVSIGVPLFNAGSKVVRLQELWRQTYPRLELIVSDNGSTDGTAQRVRRILRGKPGTCLLQSSQNRGLAWNFNRVFRKAHGQYFMWASLDDRRDFNFVEKSVEVLEKNPDSVLAVPTVEVRIENQSGCLFHTDIRGAIRARSPVERLSFVLNRFPAVGLYGVYRTSALAKTGLMASMPGGDLLLVDELALQGDFQHVPGTRLYYFGRKRWNSPEEDYRAFTGTTVRVAPGGAGIRIWQEKTRRILAARLPWREKVALLGALFAYIQREIFFRAVKKVMHHLPSARKRRNMLEALYWKGFHNPAFRIRKRKLFRARVVFPVMGLEVPSP